MPLSRSELRELMLEANDELQEVIQGLTPGPEISSLMSTSLSGTHTTNGETHYWLALVLVSGDEGILDAADAALRDPPETFE